MKFLLFFISVIFSFIFYAFFNLSKWKDIFLQQVNNPVNFLSFSWNLLIESFIFLFLWLFFVYFFSDLKSRWNQIFWEYKSEIFYFLFYISIIYNIYFISNWLNSFLIILMFLFLFSDICFNYISYIKKLKNYRVKLRYVWLLTNYIVTILLFFYIIKNWTSFIPNLMLFFNFVFNFRVHKKYTNIVSLLFSIIIIIFLLYNLFFSYFDIYI